MYDDNADLRLRQSDEQFSACARLVKSAGCLTWRQLDIFDCVVAGRDSWQIGLRFGIPESEVKRTMCLIYRSLGLVPDWQILSILLPDEPDVKSGYRTQNRRSGDYMRSAG